MNFPPLFYNFPSIYRLTALISSRTSSLVSRPFRTNTRRVASCSIIMARSSSSKVTTCRGSSFSATIGSIQQAGGFVSSPAQA